MFQMDNGTPGIHNKIVIFDDEDGAKDFLDNHPELKTGGFAILEPYIDIMDIDEAVYYQTEEKGREDWGDFYGSSDSIERNK